MSEPLRVLLVLATALLYGVVQLLLDVWVAKRYQPPGEARKLLQVRNAAARVWAQATLFLGIIIGFLAANWIDPDGFWVRLLVVGGVTAAWLWFVSPVVLQPTPKLVDAMNLDPARSAS